MEDSSMAQEREERPGGAAMKEERPGAAIKKTSEAGDDSMRRTTGTQSRSREPGGGALDASLPGRRRERYVIGTRDRKSTRLNSSHSQISYAVFCLIKITLHCAQTPNSEMKFLSVNTYEVLVGMPKVAVTVAMLKISSNVQNSTNDPHQSQR